MLRFLARLFSRPPVDPAPAPVACWSPQPGERVWAECQPCPGYDGYSDVVIVVRCNPAGDYDVRPEDDAGFVFRAFRGELTAIGPAEDMVEAMREMVRV